MSAETRDNAPSGTGGDAASTPDEAFVRDVLDHAKTQMHKGWTPAEIASNLRKRYSLTDASAKHVVGVLVAERSGRARTDPERAADDVAEALGLSREVATSIVKELRENRIDPDEPQTVRLEFDPTREVHYVVPDDGDSAPAPSPPPAPKRSRVAGPIWIEMNLLPEGYADRRERSGGSKLFGFLRGKDDD